MLVRIKLLNEGLKRRCGMEKKPFMDFQPGINLLLGPNGSGKSTILRAIQDVNTGRVGTSHIEITLEDSRFPLPMYYFSSDEVVKESDSNRGSNLMSLQVDTESHGQTLARHLMNISNLVDPAIVLLDEPETALDLFKLIEFKDILERKVDEGMQFIISTHHPVLYKCKDAYINIMGKDRTYQARAIQALKRVMTTR